MITLTITDMPHPTRYKRNAHHFAHGRCPVCRRDGERLITDHCHAHGWVRGPACEGCNQLMRHQEARYPMREMLAGLCFHRHRGPEAADRCRADWLRDNACWIRQYRNCPDCDALDGSVIRISAAEFDAFALAAERAGQPLEQWWRDAVREAAATPENPSCASRMRRVACET